MWTLYISDGFRGGGSRNAAEEIKNKEEKFSFQDLGDSFLVPGSVRREKLDGRGELQQFKRLSHGLIECISQIMSISQATSQSGDASVRLLHVSETPLTVVFHGEF